MAALLFASACAFAQEQPPDADTRQTSYVLQLFRETCGAHFAFPAKIREVAKKYAFPANPPYRAELLHGKRGQVWDASAGGGSALALVLIEAGGLSCQVHARDIDADLLQRRFRGLMEGIRSPDITVEKYDQRRVPQGGVILEQTGYFMMQREWPIGWSFTLTTSTPANGAWQASFIVAAARKAP
jgi:hypothetical protein